MMEHFVTWRTISSVESHFPSARNVSGFSSKNWIRSKSMILRSPLSKHAMSNNNDNNLEDFSFPSVRGSLDSYGELEDMTCKDGSSSPSSMLSTSSDRSTSAWPVISHGLLQCTRRNGIIYFVFSTDHKREVYMTRSSKAALSNGSGLDWTYFIHLSTNNRKEPTVRRLESSLVGRINVTTRYKISTDGSKIMETEFVLYGDNESREGALYKSPSSNDTRKRRRVPRKVSNFLKPLLHLSKHQSNSNSWGTSTLLDLSSFAPEEDEDINLNQVSRLNLSESDIPSNFELAAIIVKEQVEFVQQEMEVGGWGLNFLKRATEKQATDSGLGTVERSMDVLVPTGYHGGPKPSSLVQRLRNGGQCDCGGWDAGCSLSLLTTMLDSKGVNKSVHLYRKGEEGCLRAPSMKMVHIENGLYSVEYLPRLTALQSFSIAVAVIHSSNPTLRPYTQNKLGSK